MTQLDGRAHQEENHRQWAVQGRGLVSRPQDAAFDRENYLRVCEAIGVTPDTDEAPASLALLNLDPLEPEVLARLREVDDGE